MVSTPTPGLRLELIADGEAANTWGRKTNANLSTLDRAVSGHIDYPVFDGVNTVSTTDYQMGDWHHLGWRLTGALTQPSDLVVPLLEKAYLIENATTGGFWVTVRPPTGIGVSVPNGQRALLLCDEVNIVGTVLQPWTINNASIGAVSTTGMLARKSDGYWLTRDIVGTDEQITVTNGSGDAGPPTLSINTNFVAPGTVKARTGMTVDSGGIRVSSGGLFVETGGARFGGLNAEVRVVSNTGAGIIDVSGPSGAVVDLKDSESDDYDLRVYSSGRGGGITTANGAAVGGPLALTVPVGQQILMLNGNATIAAVVPNGLGVYTGLIDIAVPTNNDSFVQFRNSVRDWTFGVRGGTANGALSLRSSSIDVFVVSATGESTFTKRLGIASGGLSVVGNITASGGGVDFRNMTSLVSKGFADDSTFGVLWVRNSGNVGINASVPQLMLHLGNLGLARNASIRMESGGPAGGRGWDVGTNYGDFSFFINDSTAGAWRLSIDLGGRVFVHAGFTVSAGATVMNGSLTVNSTTALNNAVSIAKNGGGSTLTIRNPANAADDGCQVFYNGASWNVSTRVSQISGEFQFVNTTYANILMAITQSGACYNKTGTWGILSDFRLKENIATTRSRTEDLMRLRVVDYSLRADKRQSADRIGLIAQEVQEIMPELVFETGPHDGIDHVLAVSTSTLTPMLLGAVQDLNRRLTAIEDVINA
jgi:hypothetical protein